MQLSTPIAIPDSENLSCRRDRLGLFDASSHYYVWLQGGERDVQIYYSLTTEGNQEAPFTIYDPKAGVRIEKINSSPFEGAVGKYRLKAFAAKAGYENSELLVRDYIVNRRPLSETYVTPLLDCYGVPVPGGYWLRDYDNTNFFLIHGDDCALLYDTGFFAEGGSVRVRVEELIGRDTPLKLVISHNGPDHIQMVWEFLERPATQIYINNRDRFMLEKELRNRLNLEDTEQTSAYFAAHIFPVSEGDQFDIGGAIFKALEVPGHTAGSIALLDTMSGNLFAADCIGSNRLNQHDSVWMWHIVPRIPMDDYLSVLRILQGKLSLRNVKNVYCGHTDWAIDGTHLQTYLDNLIAAVQRIVDYGPAATSLSPCPLGKKGVVRSQVGDPLCTPYYAAVVTNDDNMLDKRYQNGRHTENAELAYLDVRIPGTERNLLLLQPNSGLAVSMNWEYLECSPAPENILEQGRRYRERPSFTVQVPKGISQIYIIPSAASHYAVLTINGVLVENERAYIGMLADTHVFEIEVTSPDRAQKRTYQLNVQETM